jgi:hypothetical protein
VRNSSRSLDWWSRHYAGDYAAKCRTGSTQRSLLRIGVPERMASRSRGHLSQSRLLRCPTSDSVHRTRPLAPADGVASHRFYDLRIAAGAP